MSNRIYDVQVGALDLAHDKTEHFLMIGGVRVPGTSVFRTVMPGDDRYAVAAEALSQMLARYPALAPAPNTGELPGMHGLTQ